MGLDWDWKSLNASHRSGVRANKIPVRNIAGSCADPNILKCEIRNLLVLIENEIKGRHKEINQRQRGCPGREEKFKTFIQGPPS